MKLGNIWRREASAAAILELAQAEFNKGSFADCAQHCTELVRRWPQGVEAHALLGKAVWQLEGASSAIPHLEEALRIDPKHSSIWLNLAQARRMSNDPKGAETALRTRCALEPMDVEAWLALSTAVAEAGDAREAEVILERCMSTSADDARVHAALGIARLRRADWVNAKSAFETALMLEPESATTAMHLAFALEMNGELGYASSVLDAAISYDVHTADIFLQAARVVRRLGEPARAVELGQRAARLDFSNPEVHYQLGCSLWALGEIESAGASFQEAIGRNPEHACAQWAFAMCALPAAQVEGAEEIAERFGARLEYLESWMSEERAQRAIDALGSFTPFFLAYVERDNHTLLARYGNLCGRIMGAQPKTTLDREPRLRTAGDKLRVGIVSAHLFGHSVWQAMVKGWFLHLDKSSIDLHAYALKAVADADMAIARDHSARFVQLEGADYRAWAHAILEDELDVLIYPEIGMHGITVQLACNRLAPVQIAAWGHPESSGLPEIDYFLSGEDFEPNGGSMFYRERLVALRHLGVHVEAPFDSQTRSELANEALVTLGISADRPILLAAGTPFKYTALHDDLLVKIASRVPAAQLVFFNDGRSNLVSQVQARIARAFATAGLEYANHVVVVEWLEAFQWRGILGRATALLDTAGFSGFNTAAQAIAMNLPIVAWDGKFLRGRLASGLLRRMEMEEWIAIDADGYVNRVARLCEDGQLRKTASDLIQANKWRAFEDLEPIRDLERFLAVHRAAR